MMKRALEIFIVSIMIPSLANAHSDEFMPIIPEQQLVTTNATVHADNTVYRGEIFDSHLHYAADALESFSPQQIKAIFDRNQISHALISSTPTDGTELLYRAFPREIIPFYSFYNGFHDKARWMNDQSVVSETESALKKGIYRGIGELHLFKQDAENSVFHEIVLLAKKYRLPLQIHGDVQVVDKVFELYPNAVVLWAHLGTQPEPLFLRTVLQRYPQRLFIDTSVRDQQLLEGGSLNSEWLQLFIDFQDRFMVAVDTYSVNRWKVFDSVVADIRNWLGDLPPEVAKKLAYKNAEKLFLNRESQEQVE